jgi:thiamine phosphate synthase YjbQ (UPF0047 family)
MKTLTKELWMEVPQRRAIVFIHEEVETLVAESGVQDGLVLVKAWQMANCKIVDRRYLDRKDLSVESGTD